MTVVNGVRLVSNSEVQSFKWCRRNWWLSWYRGLTIPYENYTSAAATGGRIHEALAVLYVPDGQTPGDPLQTLLAVQHRDVQAQALRRLEAFGDDEVKALDEVDEQLRKQFDMEQAMIQGYVEWLAETGADSEWEIIDAEKYVEADFTPFMHTSRPIKIIGKIDALMRSRVTGQVAFIDHKTGDVPNGQLLQLNQQLLHYMLLEYLHGLDQSISSKSLDSTTNVSGIQHTSSVAVSFLLRDDHNISGTTRLGSSSPRRQSREQRPDQSSASTPRLSQFSPQQGSVTSQVGVASTSFESSCKATTTSSVDGRVESQDVSFNEGSLAQAQGTNVVTRAYWNTLRRVKRTSRAKPPFYVRPPVDHNINELRAYVLKLIGTISDIIHVEAQLNAGASHQVVVYPTPGRDCTWKCQFLKVCRMFDDGSRVEAALEHMYTKRDPLSYYGGREKGGADD